MGPVTSEVERTREVDVPINLSGLVANYQVTFQADGEGNEVLVEDGAAVRFPDTELERTSTATVVIQNNGSGLGSLQEVTLSGSDEFAIAGLRLVPTDIAAGRRSEFYTQFHPLGAKNVSRLGSLRVRTWNTRPDAHGRGSHRRPHPRNHHRIDDKRGHGGRDNQLPASHARRRNVDCHAGHEWEGISTAPSAASR